MSSITLTPGPDTVEKVVWSRRSDGSTSRLFDLPCSGTKLTNRDGRRDTQPPYTCGTFARRAVIKHYLRETFGGMENSDEARKAVVSVVKEMINRTRDAWELDTNFQCKCKDGFTIGWECCKEQSKCSLDPCACPAGYEVAASVACCDNVCEGLAGNGLMEAFSYINGSDIAQSLLEGLGSYIRNDIWTTTDPWLKYDPTGRDAYKSSWEASKFEITDSGLFDATNPVVTYEEMNYPLKNSFWKQCTGLMQQVMWTMPIDSVTRKPAMPSSLYDPLSKSSKTINLTYTEEFIQSVTLQAYKSSPLYWHYNPRYVPTDSVVCKRDMPVIPEQNTYFDVGGKKAIKLGFSSMTLGGLGGADCFCGWWDPLGMGCKIPDDVCQPLVQIIGFLRICIDQKQRYNSSDHVYVLQALETLLERQPNTMFPCPSLQISDHWGFMDTNGLPLSNLTNDILVDGVSGFRKGNTDWLFDTQTSIINFKTRKSTIETSRGNAALQCDIEQNPSIANHFVDDLFPAAQGVRQSLPQTYCTRYGIELARLTVYKAAGLLSASGQQAGVMEKWRNRCQYKLEELAVCNLHKVVQAYNVTHTSTNHCPFTVRAEKGSENLFSVTPGCLIVVWNTDRGSLNGIYDPCICLALSNPKKNNCAGMWDDAGASYIRPSFLLPDDIIPSCQLQGLHDLVGETVIPGESGSVPLGSGSFASLMDKGQETFKVNTIETRTHWTEHSQIQDADLLLDWWPDEWIYPAGYHVTTGCSRWNDYHWKTFDSSWRWDTNQKRMIFSNEETNDALLRRNVFGASGVCRTNNYGMPMTGLNSMTTCTKENAKASADPMVPQPVDQSSSPWVDGQEFCAPDSTSTPWAVDRDVNPPSQWTVGTLQQENTGLGPLEATEWGPGCGPYPIRICMYDADCAAGLKCLKSMVATTGVCAKSGNKIFDCIEHSHCTNNQMCAGDGKCVDGIWKIHNKLGQDISFRTHSQQCSTGNPLITWGTSSAENVPDILRSSGLCSFRSWYENRKMAEANSCNSGSCLGFKGLFPWNFTDHRSANSAFDDDVLKIKAHPCDREYQFYEGFMACTPRDIDVDFFDVWGQTQPKPGPPGLATDTRTRTYRTDKTLPLISLTQGFRTKGFTGVPRTYNELNLGKVESMIKPCSQVNVCGLQPDFRVNGIVVTRMVLDSGVARAYTVVDMINCGSFGFLKTGSGISMCGIDYAVVPLAYAYSSHKSTLFRSVTGVSLPIEQYTPDISSVTNVYENYLKNLPAQILKAYAGGIPDTLAKYMDGVEKFKALHTILNGVSKPVYEESGIPRQIYYLTKWGAYEVPFAWWFRCCWLGGLTMDVYEIGNEQCPVVSVSDSQPPSSVNYFPFDSRLLNILSKTSLQRPASITMNNGTLLSILQILPGVLSREVFDSVLDKYKAERNSWLDRINPMLEPIIKSCFRKKEYVTEYATMSEEYQLEWVKNYMGGTGFDQSDSKEYRDVNNQTVCTGKQCTSSVEYVLSSFTSTSGFRETLLGYFAEASAAAHDAIQLDSAASRSDDWYVYIPSVVSSSDIMSQNPKWDDLKNMYPNNPDGCSTSVSIVRGSSVQDQHCVCNTWNNCSAKLQAEIISKSGIPTPNPNLDSTIILEGMGNVQACGGVFPREGCYTDAAQLTTGGNFTLLTKATVPDFGVSMEVFFQDPWDCSLFSCVNTTHPYHNRLKPYVKYFSLVKKRERVVMKAVSYNQSTNSHKENPWDSQAIQNSEITLYSVVNTNPTRWADLGYTTYCRPSSSTRVHDPDQGVTPRSVAPSLNFRLKVYTFAYYLNDVLQFELETFPCAEDINLEELPTDKQSTHWSTVVNSMSRYNLYRTSRQTQGYMCNSAGPEGLLPSADTLFQTLIPRSLSPSKPPGISTIQQAADIVKRVLTTVHSKITEHGESCLNTGCKFGPDINAQQVSEEGSADTTDLEASYLQAFCTKQKSDTMYGCAMYPGEGLIQEGNCYRYYDSYNDNGRKSCNNNGDPHPCVWSQYHSCLADSVGDTCSNAFTHRDGRVYDKKYRDMKPTGKSTQYILQTFTPECIAGTKRQCKLADEFASIPSNKRPGFCPQATSIGTAQRTRLYRQMKLTTPPELNTEITNILTLPDFDGKTDYAFDSIKADNLFLSLKTGYSCSTGTPITTCMNNTFPIEMRRNLWFCGRCPLVSQTYCTGQHNCLMGSPNFKADDMSTLSGWDSLLPQERAFLTGTNVIIDVAISATKWLIKQIMQLAIPAVGIAYEVPDFMKTYNVPDFTYSPLSVIAYSNAMETRVSKCDTTGSIPDFTNCSYDDNRRKLKAFVNSTAGGYKTQEGMIIPNSITLVWRLYKAQLTSQNIPMWLATGKKAGMFWRDMLDEKWCKKGTMQDNACYMTNDANGKQKIEVLNPGLLGDFEPLMGCDTKIINGQRVVNAMCPSCPLPKTTSDVLDILVTEGSPMQCENYYKAATGVTSNLEADSNLCGKSPVYESTCSNLQGMLGQTNYDGNPMKNVYTRIPWRGGLPPGINENPLFSGVSPGDVVSNLILKLTDIGGHCVGMEIKNSNAGPIMSIIQLPLASYASLSEAYFVKDDTLLKWMKINTAKELDTLSTIYPNSVCATWDCPLKRRAFYVGKSKTFRPYTPDPLRTYILFGSKIHPTQQATTLDQFLTGTNTGTLGLYYTSNGFCACMSPPCTLCLSDEAALTGNWLNATANPSGCSKQIDWPYPGGKLRDGSLYEPNLGTSTCGILDRLPMFKYRYTNTKRTTASAKTTLDKGGVCHMGWPIVTKIPHGCYILPDKDRFECPGSQMGDTINRLYAQTVDELLLSRLRPRLVDCESTPKFTTAGTEVKAEVSYGTLKRLETSRLLAIDLRRKLCGNSTACTPSKNWELSSFWDEVYMRNFPDIPKGDGANQTLWDQPWAACIQHTENNTQTCEGVIDRKTWIKGNRTEVCIDTIKNTTIADKLAQPVNVCDLDERMDFFCRSIQDARYKVFEANCLYSGQCRQKLFFYQPSTFSVDNTQFVRSTVQQFYDAAVSGACVPDQDTASAIRNNAENLKNCAALKLTTLAECLQIVRVIMDALVEIVFYVGNLMLYVFQMLTVDDRPELKASITQQINAILLHIKNSFLQLFNAFGDLIYKVIFEGPMGKWIMSAIIKICEFLNWVYNNILRPMICWAREIILFFLDTVATAIVNILAAFTLGKLDYLRNDIVDAKVAVKKALTCNDRNPLDCNITFRSDPPLATTLPLATRCWAGVEPGINSFACTAADTCLNEDFSKVICGACPKTISMIQFGCNTLTKLCSCNIFPRDTSYCSSHEECTADWADIECEFVDSYLEPSYGHTPCKQCPKPICLVSDGSGRGKCTCLLRPIPNQGCMGLGELVSPSASHLCLIATAGGGQGSSATYTQQYRALASAPCMLLNQATSYCMQVFTSSASASMVVGMSLLQTSGPMNSVGQIVSSVINKFGRRLLQNGSFAMAPPEQFTADASEWEGNGEPCKALVSADRNRLGILENHTLGECWRWRDVGVRLISEANMTNINPTFLVSWQDLLNTMLSEGAVPEIFSKLPSVVHSILLHAEAVQPIYITLLYWSSYIPQEMWSNRTILDQARQYLMNLTHQKPSTNGRRLFSVMAEPQTKSGDWHDGPYNWMPHHIHWNLPGKRKLLVSTPPIPVQSAVTTDPSANTVYEWSQGPYTWPPNFNYWKGSDSCAVVSTALGVVRKGLDITMNFYQNPPPEPKKVTWPNLPINDNIHISFSFPNSTTDIGAIILQYTDQVLNKTYIEDFLDSAPYAASIKSLVQCNFTRIQTCAGRYDLFWSTFQVIVILLVVGVIGKLIEIPYIETILILFFVPLVMYSAYGYALTCAPLIPVCALRDLLTLLEYILPESIEWPNALVSIPGCKDISCMRSCVSELDIGFASWQDHLAWIMCEIDSSWCFRVSNTLSIDDPLRAAIRYKYDKGIDPDSTLAARRICFVVTLANSMPSLLIALLLLSLVPSAIGVCVTGFQFATNTLFSLVIFVHSERD